MASLYEKLTAAGCEMDSHRSDLYVRDTPEARSIIESHRVMASDGADPMRVRFHEFRSSEGEAWIDVPFAYDPFFATRIHQ